MGFRETKLLPSEGLAVAEGVHGRRGWIEGGRRGAGPCTLRVGLPACAKGLCRLRVALPGCAKGLRRLRVGSRTLRVGSRRLRVGSRRLRGLTDQNADFWATHAGAELDVFWSRHGRSWGAEFQYADAPRRTRSMQTACADIERDLAAAGRAGHHRRRGAPAGRRAQRSLP